MSTSPARLAANTANAQHSTGPRTPEGQARSSQNARTHGLTARDLVIDDFSSTFGASAHPAPAGQQFEPGLPLSEVERRHVLRTLQKVHGNRTEAARLLQISVRSLQYKLKTYDREADVTSGARRVSSQAAAPSRPMKTQR